MGKKLTNEEFIKKSKEKYPGLFSYKKTKYINMNTKVCITSIEFGDFYVTPEYHLRDDVKTGRMPNVKYFFKSITKRNSFRKINRKI